VRTLLATLAALLLTAAPALARTGPVQLGTALNSGGIDNAPYVDAVRRYDAVTPESARGWCAARRRAPAAHAATLEQARRAGARAGRPRGRCRR
jgi:hypothetical protein